MQERMRSQERMQSFDQDLKIEAYLKQMQDQREQQLNYERAVIHLAMEQQNERPQHITIGKLKQMVEHLDPTEHSYPGNQTKQGSMIKTKEEIARQTEMLRRSTERAPQRRTIEDQFDSEFARRLGQLPARGFSNESSGSNEEEIDKFSHMQTFGRHNRRVGGKPGLSDTEKLEIER